MTRLIRRRDGATLHAPDDTIKMLQETLSVAQARIHHAAPDDPRNPSHVARLQRLIDDCARQRPVGSDGKHGERHTRTCGCEDAAPTRLAWLWIAWKGLERQERPLERDLSDFDAERVHGDANDR